jgi:hypothetical protein
LGNLNLIYAAGLFDYLDDRIASRLIGFAFSVLKPEGDCSLPIFKHDIEDAGCMEVVMDWWLTYRDEADVMRLLKSVDCSSVSRRAVSAGFNGVIVYRAY